MAAELTEVLKGKTVLGLQAEIGIPARPEGPSVACRVRLQGDEALVQVASSDGPARNWVAFGKFPLKTKDAKGKLDAAQFADGVAEGILNRLVRAQMIKGPPREGQADLPDPDRQCLAADPQRAGDPGRRRARRTSRPRC